MFALKCFWCTKCFVKMLVGADAQRRTTKEGRWLGNFGGTFAEKRIVSGFRRGTLNEVTGVLRNMLNEVIECRMPLHLPMNERSAEEAGETSFYLLGVFVANSRLISQRD